MEKNKGAFLGTAVTALAAHPYLWALGICLFVNFFFFGSVDCIPGYTPWVGAALVFGGAAALGLYAYRAGRLDRFGLAALMIAVAAVDLIGAALYGRSENKLMWHLMGGLAAVLLLYYVVDPGKYRRQLNSLTIMGASFLVKLCYVLGTPVTVRQHDMGAFALNGGGHAGYIEYLLANHRLFSEMDIRNAGQFYHPPLHHAISAAWVFLGEKVLRLDYVPARESIQTLTLFYSVCILISAYQIFRYFRLEGPALYIPLVLVGFHPTFILLAGSVNNDVLSVAFILGAVVSTLKWYENQTMKGILKIALCVGLGMMTKLSAAMVAPPIAVVFLIVLLRKWKTDGKRLMGQFCCFGLLCVPLGMWFGIRNLVKWGVPFTYVPAFSTRSSQYLGKMSFLSRVTDFSPRQFANVYQQWASHGSYNEYNPLVALLKTSLFGEAELIVKESSAAPGMLVAALPAVLFWVNVAIAAIAFAAMFVIYFKKNGERETAVQFLLLFYLVTMVGYYKMTAEYPHVCTMDFRYIAPTAVLGAAFLGMLLQELDSRGKTLGRTAAAVLGGAAFVFSFCSGIIYMVFVK